MPIVFLSSVARGLEGYRDSVYTAIERLDGFHCVRMEDFGSRDASPHTLCFEKVAECDIFLGILGHRYGSVDRDTGKSFSESEYDAALTLGKPPLMFMAPEESPIPANLIESDEIRERQANFRARVNANHAVARFEGNDELASLVIAAIHNRRNQFLEEGSISQGRTMTRLLFPFVTNQAGFDTGIAISNVSSDPFGTEQQDGNCTIHYYGRMIDGSAPLRRQASSVIRAGEQLTFNLSSGGTGLISATPGFTGYLIAECRFKASGFAFLSDLGARRIGSC